jgi:hypothetical protein
MRRQRGIGWVAGWRWVGAVVGACCIVYCPVHAMLLYV